jgi:benzil reductase ((S)-benzoin forming)
MPTPITLITGASRGLGLAIAQQLVAQGHRVLTIARQRSDALPPSVTQWTDRNLADPGQTLLELEAWLGALDLRDVASITLINNAGVVTTPAPIGRVSAADISNALRVGLEAPVLLSSVFLRATAGWACPRKLLLISSGLGRRGMASSAPYCAAKAGMDNFARAVALEEALLPNGAKVVSLAPGVIDTDMQVQLRSAEPAMFPDRAMFVGMHSGGQLDSPATAAEKVLKFIVRADFGSKVVTDLREA